MTYLFDISPEEVPDDGKKSARARKRQDWGGKKPVSPADSSRHLLETPAPAAPPPSLGRTRHYLCECGGDIHEILSDYRGYMRLLCLWCARRQTVPAVRETQAGVSAQEFVFSGGRFHGMTVAQVIEQPDGERYLVWAAANAARVAEREACQRWIDASKPAV